MPMTKQTGKPEWWEQAKKELSEADPVMAEIIKANPEVPRNAREPFRDAAPFRDRTTDLCKSSR